MKINYIKKELIIKLALFLKSLLLNYCLINFFMVVVPVLLLVNLKK